MDKIEQLEMNVEKLSAETSKAFGLADAQIHAVLQRITELEAQVSHLKNRVTELELDRDTAPLPADYGKGFPF